MRSLAHFYRISLQGAIRLRSKMGPLTVVTLLLLVAVSSQARDLCPRIFFQNIDENEMPYKPIEGVYVKQPDNYNNFPVYKGEITGLLFHYVYFTSSGNKFLMFGSKLNDYFGVAAKLNSWVNPLTWLSSGTLDKPDVFSGLISKWQYHDMRADTNYFLNGYPSIKAVCVDEDFRQCDSNNVYITDTITDGRGNILNDASRDQFSRRTNEFRNLRPVYYQSTAKWYLQYDRAYWIIGTNRYANYNSNGVNLRVKDYALRPEFITNRWEIYCHGWKTASDSIKIRCRGIQSGSNGCTTGGSPCGSNAKCVYTSGNETVCDCKPGYTSPRCSINKQCPVPTLITGELGVKYNERTAGSLMVVFCATARPSVRFGVCQDGGFYSSWSRKGSACGVVPTTYPATTRYPGGGGGRVTPPNAQKIDFDDYPAVLPSVLTCAVLLQVFLPMMIWLCALCMRKCKESTEGREDATRMQEVSQHMERRLHDVARAESQDQLDQELREYQDTVQDYQRETEATEKKRKRGLYQNASFWRLYSMGMWFSFLMWAVFLIGCRASQCIQYGVIFYHLWLMAIIMCVIAPIIFLIESIVSHERSYIRNIMEDETAWEYIKRMHEVAPIINMQVECYHKETRTRGNETYQVKVTTFVDTDTFHFGSWLDVSKREMPQLSTVALTRLKIDPIIEFGDLETAQSFETQRDEMLDRNRHRDKYKDFSCSMEVPGLKKRISAYVDLRSRPFWIRERYYWLATLLCMTWPYRWVFRAKTAKNYYDLKKKMFKSDTPPAQIDLVNPLALLQLGMNPANPGFQGSSANLNQVVAPLVPPSAPYPPTQGTGLPYPPAAEASAPPYSPPSGPYLLNQGGYPPTQGGYPQAQGGYPLDQCLPPKSLRHPTTL